MARKKLNTALVAAVASVGVLAVGGYLAQPLIISYFRPVSKLVAMGDDAVQKGDWENAALYYGKAASRAGTDIDLQLKYADAQNHNVHGDAQKLMAVRQTDSAILSNDPRSVPALRAVLGFQRLDVQRNPADNAAIRSLAGTADRLLKVVPNDREARLAMVTTVFEPYIRNVEVKPEDVDAQRASADKLVEEKPDDAEAVRMATQFRLVGAQKALAVDVNDAKEKIKAAMAYSDATIAKTPDLAGAWAVRGDVYRIAAYVLPDKDTALRDKYFKEFTDSLKKADALVKPGDPLMISIHGAYLRQLEFSDAKAAEAGYRKLLAEAPDDRQPRLMLAEFLARLPGRRDDAVAVLTSPFTPTKPLAGMESVDAHQYALIEQVRRTSLRLGTVDAVTDPVDRKKRIDIIDKEFHELSSDPEIGTRFKPALLRIQGGLQLAQGNIAEAVATLDQALKQMNPDSQSPIEQDMRNDALLEYAQAELRLNQSGEARPALQDLVQHKPENLAARVMLTDLLIKERNTDAAEQQMAVLEKVVSDSPIIKQMRLTLNAIEGKLAGGYKDMPEANRDQQFLKLRAAATLNDTAEVARLAKLMTAANPADREGVVALVQASLVLDKRSDAIDAVNAALKAKPNDPGFKGIAENLAAPSDADRKKLAAARIESITDPYEKALATGNLAAGQGRPADAIIAYQAAQKLKPDDARGFEAQFQVAVAAGRFPDAEAVLGDLTRLNSDQAGGSLRKVQLAAAKAAAETDPARRQDQFKAVASQAQTAAQQNPELASATLLYAQVLQQSGDNASAADQYQATLDKSPTNMTALIGIADCMMRTDRRQDAATRIAAAKAMTPDDARVKELEMAYEMRFGDPAKALDTLAAQAAQNPDDPQAAARLGLALEQAAATKQGDEAKSFLTRAADVYTKGFERFPQDLRFLSAYTEVERHLGQPQVAEAAAEKAANDPQQKDKTNAQLLLGDQYVKSGKLDDAARVFNGLINDTKPAPVEAVTRLALIYARQNRVPDALKTLDLRSDDASVQRQRVALLLDGNDITAARAAMDAAVAAHPDPDTYAQAAYVELRGGDMDRAEAFANKVLAVRPNDMVGLFYRAQAKLNHTPPNLDGARDDLIKARDGAPRANDVRLLLAEVYSRRGERDAAITELQAAWQNDKSSKAALLRLADAYAGSTPPAWAAAASLFDEARNSPQLASDPDVMFAEANVQASRGNATQAVAIAKRAVSIDPKNFQLVQRYYDTMMRAGAFRDILAETESSLNNDPGTWWIYRLRAQAYAKLNQQPDAQKSLDAAFNMASATADPNVLASVARAMAEILGPKAAAAKLDPYADPSLQVMSGELSHDAGDVAASIAKLEPLVADGSKLRPEVLQRAKQALGMDYLQSVPANAAKARATFEDLLKQTPDDVTLLNNLACVLLLPDSGATPAEAMKPAQRAYDLINGATSNPQLAAVVQDTYGWALVKNNRASEGMDILRRASESANFPDVFLHLAEGYLAGNDAASAESALGDARTRMDAAAKRNILADPTMEQKYKELSDQLAKKKAAAGG